MSEEIKVSFVIPKHFKDHNDCSEDMLVAFAACNNHKGGGMKACWVHENLLNLDILLPAKKHIFVLSEFEGELYDQLKSTKCLLVGPRCLSCCFTEGNSIPSRGHPVFTVAMRGLVVTASGLPKDVKTNIKKKIEWMGGTYSPVLTDATTHLISNNVFSDKYIKAAERGIPVMRETWVAAVWDASLKLDVSGSSSEFDNHRLPPFANLQITTSGLTVHDKKLIMKLINSNGGEFSRVFQSQTTDVLVLTKDNVGSEKYKAAIEYGKVCVTPHWIKDSAALGFALPVARYKICSASTSSPIAESRLPDMSLNFSRITKDGRTSNFVNETRTADVQILSGDTKLLQESRKDSSVSDEIQRAFESVDLGNIKKAEPIFDGFCIWVTGLEGVSRERACACVSRGGGVRYDGPHERVTHVVAGAGAAAAAAALPAVPVLSPLWLLKSIEAGRVLDEMEFLVNAQPATPAKVGQPARAAPSPMSKRNLQLLLPAPPAPAAAPAPSAPAVPFAPAASPEPALSLHLHSPQDQLLHHYLSQNLPNADVSKSLEPILEKKRINNEDLTIITQSEFTVVDNIFKEHRRRACLQAGFSLIANPEYPYIEKWRCKTEDGVYTLIWSKYNETSASGKEINKVFMSQLLTGIVFEVQGLEEEAICELASEIAEAGGALAAAGAGGSRVLVPLDFDTDNLLTKDAEAVTVFWVKECLCQQALVPVEYYHRPVRLSAAGVAGAAPLRGVVASLSTYTGVERAFLDELAKLLGATTQQRFCRRDTASALASTHLICPEASGAKYAGALKWAVPAVRASWLLACAAAGARVPEADHAVDAPPPPAHAAHATHPELPPSQVQDILLEQHQQSKDVIDLNSTEAVQPQLGDKFESRSSVPEADQDLMLPPGATAARPPGSLARNADKNKKQSKKAMFEGMSPATRFITMWRMGMFNSDHEDSSKEGSPKEDSPKEESEDSIQEVEPEREYTMQTPPLDDVLLTPNLRGLSPTTRRRLQAVKRGEMPSDPVKTPINPFDKRRNTPNSKIGGDLRPGCKRMSVDARKRLWGFVNDLPSENIQPDDQNTPLSDLCGTFLAQFDKKGSPFDHGVARKLDLEDPVDTPPSKMAKFSENQCAGGVAGEVLAAEVEVQLQRLSSALTGRRTPRAARPRSSGAHRTGDTAARGDMEYDSGPESQPNTVGWDDTTPSQKDYADQISKPKRVKTAPTEMIRTHLGPKCADFKQNIPITDPPNECDKNDAGNNTNHEHNLKKEDYRENDPAVGNLSSSNIKHADDSVIKDIVPVKDDVLSKAYAPNQNENEGVENVQTDGQLQENLLSPSKSPRLKKTFMLSSNVDNREETVEMIVRLGGAVTDLEEEAAAPATHLLCAAPARSQRILNSIAAGCWVLHPAYVARSAAAGAFLPAARAARDYTSSTSASQEEDTAEKKHGKKLSRQSFEEEPFEWGNPVAECLPSVSGGERALALAAHRWRSRRARGRPGPFAGAVALLHVPAARRHLLARFILAGGGAVTDQQPPYTDESITVCFADPKRYPMKSEDKEWLVSRGVPVCAPILLSAFLTEQEPPDARAHCLPDFAARH